MTSAAPSKAPPASSKGRQLLHLVIGGELKDVTGVEFRDLSKIDFIGAFPSYKAAYDAWKGAAQRTVDNAHMRYFILHAHRLLDPETGHTHDV
jgi:myo-inositol-1(or 4)-monophosphatase